MVGFAITMARASDSTSFERLSKRFFAASKKYICAADVSMWKIYYCYKVPQPVLGGDGGWLSLTQWCVAVAVGSSLRGNRIQLQDRQFSRANKRPTFTLPLP
jgi:hypothetical protein